MPDPARLRERDGGVGGVFFEIARDARRVARRDSFTAQRLPETATATPSSENTRAHALMMVSVSSLEASSYALTSSLEYGYVCATTEAKHSSSHRAASCAGDDDGHRRRFRPIARRRRRRAVAAAAAAAARADARAS